MRSSARKIGVVEPDTFSNESVTCASWPTLMRSGCACRSIRIRVRRVRTSAEEMTGRATSSTPNRGVARKAKTTPASTRTMPEPKNARPRVVRTLRRARTVGPPASACGRRDRHLAQEVDDDVGGGAAGQLGLAGGHEPVREHRGGEDLHVVGDDVVASL